MFKKLRDKLKNAVSVFSKKTEEVAEEVEKEIKEETEEATKKVKIEESVNKKNASETEKRRGFFKRIFKKEEPTKEAKEKEDEIKSKKIFELRKEEEIVKPKVEEDSEKVVESREKIKKDEREEKLIKEVEEKKLSKEEVLSSEIKKESLVEVKPVKRGFFSKLKQVIATRIISTDKFEELFWGLELILLENNVSVEVIEKIKGDLREELVDKPLPRAVDKKITETLASSLSIVLDQKFIDLLNFDKKPLVVAFFGINGSGKTTTIAKIAQKILDKKKSVVLAAGDTFRAAAIHQLEEHANKLGVKIIKHDYGADAAAVAYDAVAFANKNKVDVVLIDTAGRLHSDTNLMDELHKIVRVSKPDLKIFVGESITGNDCVEQASKFNEKIGIDGIILTKADVDERGGTAISISYVTKKPILYLGTGQEYKDLIPFSKKDVLEGLGLV